VPTKQGHYCFLVRIEAPADKIMQDGWVPFDNNICQRNVHILDAPAAGPTPVMPTPSTAGFGFGNRNLGSGMGTITVTSNNMPSTGTCTLTFTDAGLFQRWQQAGGTVRGGQVIRGTPSIQVDIQPRGAGSGLGAMNLTLDRVPMQPEELSRLDVKVSGPPGAQSPTIEIKQTMGGQGVGGNIIRPPVKTGPIYLPAVSRTALVGGRGLAERPQQWPASTFGWEY